MTSIVIDFGKDLEENTNNPSDDMAHALRYIADQIEEGYTSGQGGAFTWDIKTI
jgi:hypothetical protein